MSLRLVRKVARISQSELARRSGVANAAISRFEHPPGSRSHRRLRRADYTTIAKLAAALDLDPGDLLTLVEATPIVFPKYHDAAR
jgi:transcriptional regulator with XRE-family HTH domain